MALPLSRLQRKAGNGRVAAAHRISRSSTLLQVLRTLVSALATTACARSLVPPQTQAHHFGMALSLSHAALASYGRGPSWPRPRALHCDAVHLRRPRAHAARFGGWTNYIKYKSSKYKCKLSGTMGCWAVGHWRVAQCPSASAPQNHPPQILKRFGAPLEGYSLGSGVGGLFHRLVAWTNPPIALKGMRPQCTPTLSSF